MRKIIILFLFVALSAQSQTFKSDRFLKVDTLINAFIKQSNIPGISLAVSKQGQVIYAKGYGYANIQEQRKMTTKTKLRTASVAKVITATAIGKLVSDKKLNLDAPIKNYLPYINKKYENLTCRQLAGHTSGLKHRPAGNSYKKRHYRSTRETVELMDSDLLFEPNTDYKYSSHAFNLLAAVIEKVSGKNYMSFMNENIFKQLNMKHTVAENIDELDEDDASLYYIKKGKLLKDKLTSANYKLAGAGFRSTPTDLVNMMKAYNSDFITTKVVEELFKSHQLKNGEKTNVGIAWRKSMNAFGKVVMEHAGSWKGARTVLVHYPKDQLNIAIMINADCPVLIEETAHILAKVILSSETEQKSINIKNKPIELKFNALNGEETYKGELTLRWGRGILKSEKKGFLNECPIYQIGQSTFAAVTIYGLLYTNMTIDEKITGKVYMYYNRNSDNPLLKKPIASFTSSN